MTSPTSLRTATPGDVAAARDEAPLPHEVRSPRLSLDGAWEVQLEPGAAALPIEVPWTFEAPLSGIGRGDEIHERLRYRRTFAVPEAWRGSHVLLRFGGVDWRARVLVDGAEVGAHEGGYTHFSFGLGPIEPGRAHELVVEVDDPDDGPQPRGKQRGSGGIWYTRTTGIWRPVWLEAVPAAYVTAFALEPSLDGRVDVRVETSAPTEATVRIGGVAARVVDGTATLVVPDPRPWSPEDPVLYDAVVETASGDRIESYVGFRTVERRGAQILLNGQPRRLAGVLDQGFWPDGVYTAPTSASLRADVEAAKAFGFDLARMHVKVADPRWYGWCDRLGLLVVQDIPSSRDLPTGEARAAFAREALHLVEQAHGHPCVVAWVVFNEDWGSPPAEFQLDLTRRIRELDPTRLVVDASGWHHRGESDLLDVHDYGDDLSRHASGELPLVVGECGGVSLAVHGHARPADFAYREVATADELAAAYERLVGGLGNVAGFVWTQLTDVEGELNGLLTYDRIPKLPPDRIRAANERFRRKETQR